MKKLMCVCLAVLLILGCLGGCSQGKEKLYVYNWGVYIDPDVLDEFEEENDCTVVYENYKSNEEMYLKLKNSNANYDVIFPSDYMIEKLIKEDMLHALNYENIPNFENIDPFTLNQSFDKDNTYSVPYFYGTVGILYNKTMVKETVDSWEILFDENYKGEILMYDSQRDSLGVALKSLGYSMNTKNEEEINEATQKLIAQKPLVLAYVDDQVIDMMIGNEAALAVVYSGDAIYAMTQNPDLGYAVPKEGSNLWFDNMAIPASSQNPELAEKFINFMCRPEIAAKNTREVGYTTSNVAARELVQDEEFAQYEAYTITKETMDNCEIFHDPGEFLSVYADAWEKVKTD